MIAAICLALLHGHGDLKKEIQARYDTFSLGMEKQDPKVLKGLMTHDFSGDTPEGGTMNRDQAVQQFVGIAKMSKDAHWSRKVVKLTAKGPAEIALVEGHFSGQMPGRDGKSHLFELTSQVQDTWVRASGKWQVQHSHMLKVSMKMDGKPMQHP